MTPQRPCLAIPGPGHPEDSDLPSAVGVVTDPGGPSSARVTVVLDQGRFLLDDGSTARQALSCLVVPEPGDLVHTVATQDGTRYIVHVLCREPAAPGAGPLRIEAPGVPAVTLSAPRLTLQAYRELALVSHQDATMSAPAGQLTLVGKELHLTALEHLLQTARQVIGRCDHWLQEARGLLRLHSRQTLVSADEDVRVDGQRISMG